MPDAAVSYPLRPVTTIPQESAAQQWAIAASFLLICVSLAPDNPDKVVGKFEVTARQFIFGHVTAHA